jgi:ubiquinone biosynthesis protein COQ9
MLDLATPRGAIIAAALRLAAERPWEQATLADIAQAAGSTLQALKKEFGSKGDILAAFIAAVDDEVLVRAPRRTPEQPARDALFEVIMCRFDVLAPYKAALRSIVKTAVPEPARVRPLLASQCWMLEAAGIASDGLQGTLKIAGLATVYASVFRTWLDDDDPGHARTMAALDRRLRRGERTLGQVEAVCAGLARLACAAMPRGFSERPSKPAPSPTAPDGPHTGPVGI